MYATIFDKLAHLREAYDHAVSMATDYDNGLGIKDEAMSWAGAIAFASHALDLLRDARGYPEHVLDTQARYWEEDLDAARKRYERAFGLYMGEL